MSDVLRQAAREALDAHDALKATDQTEPALNAHGLPVDPTAWLIWNANERRPAYARWDAAMTVLADALDDPAMSRHPFNFRPVCEAILQ